jgi:hypothetical protein
MCACRGSKLVTSTQMRVSNFNTPLAPLVREVVAETGARKGNSTYFCTVRPPMPAV